MDDVILMKSSIITQTVDEEFIGLLVTVTADGANFYCIEGALSNQTGQKNNEALLILFIAPTLLVF